MRLVRGVAADLGRAGAGRIGRIDEVDVEAAIRRRGAHHLAGLDHHVLDAALEQLFGADDGDATGAAPADVLVVVHGAADADLDHPFRVQQAFLDGAADAINLAKLGSLAGETMPIRLTEKLGAENLPGGAMRLASGDFHSRFLRLFEGVRRQNLAALEFYDVYHAAPTGSGKVLLSYADGTPALTESAIGLGTLLVCNFSVAEASSNLASQRLFPAWIHEMLLRINPTGSAAMEPFLVGDSIAGETWAAEAAGRDVTGPDGMPVPVRADVLGERFRVSFNAAATGFYRLPGSDSHDLLAFAVNPDPDQSDLRAMDPAVLPDRAGTAHPDAAFVGGTTDYQVLLRGRPVFQWFLLAAHGFLLMEGILFKSAPRTS